MGRRQVQRRFVEAAHPVQVVGLGAGLVAPPPNDSRKAECEPALVARGSSGCRRSDLEHHLGTDENDAAKTIRSDGAQEPRQLTDLDVGESSSRPSRR